MGERKESVISRSSASGNFSGAGRAYVRFVVEASYFAPLYMGKEMLYLYPYQHWSLRRQLGTCCVSSSSRESWGRPSSGNTWLVSGREARTPNPTCGATLAIPACLQLN